MKIVPYGPSNPLRIIQDLTSPNSNALPTKYQIYSIPTQPSEPPQSPICPLAVRDVKQKKEGAIIVHANIERTTQREKHHWINFWKPEIFLAPQKTCRDSLFSEA